MIPEKSIFFLNFNLLVDYVAILAQKISVLDTIKPKMLLLKEKSNNSSN